MLRATLKSLLSRKVRLVLSGLAVVLGVMFVSGSFVLTDTMGRSFDQLFASVYTDVDVEVHAAAVTGDLEAPSTVPADRLTQVRATPGVATATGVVQVNGARIVGANGKVVPAVTGTPRYGRNWTGTSDLVVLRQGHGPAAGDQIAINAALAQAAGVKVGDRVGILTRAPKKTFTLVGIFGYSGGRDSLAGTQEIAFTEPVAQQLMLGGPGRYSHIDVRAVPGVSAEAMRDRLNGVVGPGYEAKTGKQMQAAESASARKDLNLVNNVFLGFAGVALFVGVFLILNTFSIIVAQRTRELALMRAIGGSRRQMIGSVLAEAVVIGLIASGLGLAAGVGVGTLLAYIFGNTGGSELALAGVSVPPSAVIAAFGVGLLVTLTAALLPALRAARIPPMAALQEVATPDRPLTRVTAAGGIITALGAATLGLGLSGRAHSSTLWLILAGILIGFIGFALLTPLIARPVVSALGRLLSWSVPGKLGRRNAARNPRRTAITAAALMVGVALVTGVNVVLASTIHSLHKQGDTMVKADLIIAGEPGEGLPPTFDPAVLTAAKQIPGVRDISGEYVDFARVGGKDTAVTAPTDLVATARMFPMRPVDGTIRALGADELVVDNKLAKEYGLHAGSTVQIQLSHGRPHAMTVVGVFQATEVSRGWYLSPASVRDFELRQPVGAYLRLADGANLDAIRTQVDKLLADSPEVSVGDRSAFIAQQTAILDKIVSMIQILLALAILVAVLGIINTLALSVLERTRELGLLRAIGLGRGQTMRMITVEAVVISVFGALLGVAVGTGLGASVVRALKSQGIGELALPWQQMATYVALAALVGVVAAILPAIRAARNNVLAAIAYE
jgi:putative ABC transport system permease protein